MPLETHSYDLEAVKRELEERAADLADRLDEGDTDADTAPREQQEIVQEGQQVDKHLAGVQWALGEGYDEVTLGGLTAGEYARVGDRTLDAQAEQIGGASSTEYASGILFTAAGVVDAPFLDEGAGFEVKAMAVRELSPQFQSWLESEVDDLTTPDVDLGNGFAARVSQTSTTPDR